MRQPTKMRVMTIVHGQSEYCICSSIKSNLRIMQEIIAKDKGKKSIQITSILAYLHDFRFSSFQNFIHEFPDIESKEGKLIHFKLFIIMDVDDCTSDQKECFLNKKMFAKHWLCEYIVPVFNEPNLEATMEKCKIEVKKKKDYIRIFPTNHGDLDIDKAKEFLAKLGHPRIFCVNVIS